MAAGTRPWKPVPLATLESTLIGDAVFPARPTHTAATGSGEARTRSRRRSVGPTAAVLVILLVGASCTAAGSDDSSSTTTTSDAEADETTTTIEEEGPDDTVATTEIDEIDPDPGGGDPLTAEYTSAMGAGLTAGGWGFEDSTECVAESWVALLGVDYFEDEGISPGQLAAQGFDPFLVFSADDALELVDETLACGVDPEDFLGNLWARDGMPFDGFCIADALGPADTRLLIALTISGGLLQLDSTHEMTGKLESAAEGCPL